MGEVVVGLPGRGPGEVRLRGFGVFRHLNAEDRVRRGGRWFDCAGCVLALPGVAVTAFQPNPAEPCFASGLRSVNPHLELLAWSNAAGHLVGRVALKWAATLCVAGFSGEGDEVQAQQILERILKLLDLEVQFKEQTGFGLGVQLRIRRVVNPRADIEHLPVDGGQLVRGVDP